MTAVLVTVVLFMPAEVGFLTSAAVLRRRSFLLDLENKPKPGHKRSTSQSLYLVQRAEMTSSLVLVVWLVLVFQIAADDDCPIELHPPSVVVKYGETISAICSTCAEINGMSWDKHSCNLTTMGMTIEPPDSVSVSSMNSTDSVVEGSRYHLKCEIQNIAPVQNLTVKWYKGDTLVPGDGNYLIEDGKSDREKAPVNVSSTLLITPSRADDGAEYSCEAELDLGPEGPQPPISVKSTPLSITVHSPRKSWIVMGAFIGFLLLVSICICKHRKQKGKEADRRPNSSDPLISMGQQANNGGQSNSSANNQAPF